MLNVVWWSFKCFLVLTNIWLVACESLQFKSKTFDSLEENEREEIIASTVRILIDSEFTCEENDEDKIILKCRNHGECVKREKYFNLTHYRREVFCSCPSKYSGKECEYNNKFLEDNMYYIILGLVSTMVCTTAIALVMKYVLCKRKNDRTAFLKKGVSRSITSNSITNYRVTKSQLNKQISSASDRNEHFTGAMAYSANQSPESRPMFKQQISICKGHLGDSIGKTNSLDVNSLNTDSFHDASTSENLNLQVASCNGNSTKNKKITIGKQGKKKNDGLEYSEIHAYHHCEIRENANDE